MTLFVAMLLIISQCKGLNVELDNQVNECIFNGSWPTGKKYVIGALKNMRRMKNENEIAK